MYGRLAGALLIPLALLLDFHAARAAVTQAWSPFVLVAGLLLIGRVAGNDGLFKAAASRYRGRRRFWRLPALRWSRW
jgi:hypothetical protein